MGDIIKKPDHYCEGRKYEPKDVIRDWGLNFNLGSAVKYISRAGRKGDILEDLKKAKQFLQFEIEAEETEDSKDDIGMTCKEAAEIGEAIAKGFEEGIKDKEVNSDIVRDIPTKELRDMDINWIIELINNDKLDRMDIPDGLYDKCERIRAAIANSEYRKALDGIRKYAEDTEDTASINFEFEVDPDIDTDTVNVHVHIKNKED